MRRVGHFVMAMAAVVAITLLDGCAPAAIRPGVFADNMPAMAAETAIEVASGVYVVQGAAGEAGAANLGRVGNAGFIVGPTGVMAIDTGTSYRHGVALLAAIRRVTDLPVRLALVTHTRQEFLFGAAAYREQGIPVHMQREAAALMRARCDRCLKTLQQTLGNAEMQDTVMFTPDVEFDTSHILDAIGRRVEVLYYGHSSGPGDTAVLDLQTGALFAGGLLDHRRIPDVQDSDFDGWMRALQGLRELPVRSVVPGHGAASSVQLIDATGRYLAQLRDRVLALLQSGAALSEVPAAAALPEFAQWDQYPAIHRRNASILFVRFEREQMNSGTDSR